MKPLRMGLAMAGLLTLSAAPLSAQSSKIACKDGSAPKGGHFSCWGHGGLVSAAKPAKSAKPAERAATTEKKKKTSAHKPKTHTASKATKKKKHAKKG